jgi:hypothetical protein
VVHVGEDGRSVAWPEALRAGLRTGQPVRRFSAACGNSGSRTTTGCVAGCSNSSGK